MTNNGRGKEKKSADEKKREAEKKKEKELEKRKVEEAKQKAVEDAKKKAAVKKQQAEEARILADRRRVEEEEARRAASRAKKTASEGDPASPQSSPIKPTRWDVPPPTKQDSGPGPSGWTQVLKRPAPKKFQNKAPENRTPLGPPDSKRRRGFSKFDTDSDGNPIRVPQYKPAQLAGRGGRQAAARGRGGHTIHPAGRPPQTTVPRSNFPGIDPRDIKPVSYAQIAGANSNNSMGEISPQQLSTVEVRVMREDKGPLSQEEQLKLQVAAAADMNQARLDGVPGHEWSHSGTRLFSDYLVIRATASSAEFYKRCMNLQPGYEAFLPQDLIKEYEIYATLPSVFENLVSNNFSDNFSAGTFGKVLPSQVRLYKQPWSHENGSIHVYAKIDEAAFEWLKQATWCSAIGLHMVRWAHAPVSGITGYISPDTNIDDLRASLRQNLVPQPQAASSFQERHVSGEDQPVLLEDELEQLEETMRAVSTPVREEAQVCGIPLPKDAGYPPLDATRSRSSPSAGTPAKNRRTQTRSGSPLRDPSESDSDAAAGTFGLFD